MIWLKGHYVQGGRMLAHGALNHSRDDRRSVHVRARDIVTAVLALVNGIRVLTCKTF